jgi:predicted lipoprotein with Yx(FWY)xxD motif
MNHKLRLLLPLLGASALLTACGSSSSSSTGTQSAAQPQTGPSSNLVVKTAANSKLGGNILVDAKGMTLYHLTAEHNGSFICTTGACLQVWHPVSAQTGQAPSGVGSLGTIKRPDGSTQVTYKGSPLYTFAQDQAPGQANGQGFKDVGTWTAIRASGSTSSASGGAATTAPSSSGGGGSSGY